MALSPDSHGQVAPPSSFERLNVWDCPPGDDVCIEHPQPHPGLQMLLASPQPVAWMLAGDDHSPSDAEFPGLCQRFVAELRPHRRSDPVINVAWPYCRMADVRMHLSAWLRNAPDVLLVLSGAADATAGVQALNQFEADVDWILGRCLKASTLPVLATQPLPLHTEADADCVGSLVYAEAVRALSAEWDVPIVDFREEWEQIAIRQALPGSWIDESGTRPTAIGCMHLVGQLVREIDMHRVASRQPAHSAELPAAFR